MWIQFWNTFDEVQFSFIRWTSNKLAFREKFQPCNRQRFSMLGIRRVHNTYASVHADLAQIISDALTFSCVNWSGNLGKVNLENRWDCLSVVNKPNVRPSTPSLIISRNLFASIELQYTTYIPLINSSNSQEAGSGAFDLSRTIRIDSDIFRIARLFGRSPLEEPPFIRPD